ncbi:iron-containing redox enzyme family protein [Pseudoalteromonas luteoviolacea]|uniref:Iron-containing redox enzyme family protein n=1 Tax=Pseudoalteromonas luteoviolacea NCIMB 1942 TaxID=1365253 RepID=A0A167CLV3_9GAMM|nr:iron-containing redox enzyme family protein [Pseudoalteromonas luteoviolacea]KZN47817.1 hypothetical protein N482_08880 [Pseudoalteromonas luteoviolacea NCIMB 1942]
MMNDNLSNLLNSNPLRMELQNHSLFSRLKEGGYEMDDVAYMLGQWWHPLHYFPTFLANCIATLPTIESKCAITKILNQEVGDGEPRRSHESIYISTMTKAGFDIKDVTQMAGSKETVALLKGFKESSFNKADALGFIFATEVVDLALVSSIGIGVEKVTGKKRLPWVEIHLIQEPDHVEEADNSLMSVVDADEFEQVSASADNAWRLWIDFFDQIEQTMFASAAA